MRVGVFCTLGEWGLYKLTMVWLNFNHSLAHMEIAVRKCGTRESGGRQDRERRVALGFTRVSSHRAGKHDAPWVHLRASMSQWGDSGSWGVLQSGLASGPFRRTALPGKKGTCLDVIQAIQYTREKRRSDVAPISEWECDADGSTFTHSAVRMRLSDAERRGGHFQAELGNERKTNSELTRNTCA